MTYPVELALRLGKEPDQLETLGNDTRIAYEWPTPNGLGSEIRAVS